MVSDVLRRTLALFLRRDELTVAQLAANVEQDVVIASTVLAIANSAMYGGYSTVASVRQAIARLGINKTRNVLLGLSVTRSFSGVRLPSGWSLTRFNAHSLASAALSDLIVRNAPSAEPEWAFMAGLLHDVGLFVVAFGLPDQFKAIMAHQGGDLSLTERERSVLGFTHFDVGAEVMSRWNFPAAVQEAALFSQCTGFEFTKPLPLGAVVKSATLIADAQTLSVFPGTPDPSVTDGLLAALEITNPTQFIAEFRSDYRELMNSPT